MTAEQQLRALRDLARARHDEIVQLIREPSTPHCSLEALSLELAQIRRAMGVEA